MNEPLTYDEKLELKYLLFRFCINNVGNNEVTFASKIIMESINRELIAEANKEKKFY